jgi:hypothetical protein
MNQPVEKAIQMQRVSMYLNYACLIVVFGALLAIKIHIYSSADYSARWLVIQYLPFFLLGGAVWIFACVISIASWMTKGNSKTPLIERAAALSLPVCAAIIAVT